ncbi:NfeD family protein [Luteimonas sp. BDR2-5]|uniref:NfeD family protein n=1 Tax=Proluteimonas luteida TaxID=2878685 RepID=UPI001E48F2C7|nr:NfeD family protein [Luteimonas sp. BDR2-5]MCD9027506.1 NfeD family protein [Luteimonas sp. BDR2-5]
MRWDVVGWGALALLLMAAETLAPGAFMLWMGFAAAAVFLILLVAPGLSILSQVALFVVLSFVSILVYRKWFRRRERQSDHPTLNRRAAQHIGRVVPLEQPIVAGRGRVKIGDAFWVVEGPDLAVGTSVRIVGTDGVNLHVEPAGEPVHAAGA